MNENNHAIKAALYSGDILRICTGNDPLREFPQIFSLADGIDYEKLLAHRDGKGRMHVKRRNMLFIYDPPTGNFIFSRNHKEIINGIIRSYNSSGEQLLFRLLPDDQVFGLGAIAATKSCNTKKDSPIFPEPDFSHSSIDVITSFPFFIIKRNKNFCAIFLNVTNSMRVIIDNRGEFSDGPCIRINYADCDKDMPKDIFFFHGDLPAILNSYTDLTGKTFLPPLWSFGFQYLRTEEANEINKITEIFQKLTIPLDVIHLKKENIKFPLMPDYLSEKNDSYNMPFHDIKTDGIHTTALFETGVSLFKADKSLRDTIIEDCLYSTEPMNIPSVSGKNIYLVPDFSTDKVREWWTNICHAFFERNIKGIGLCAVGLETNIKSKKKQLLNKLIDKENRSPKYGIFYNIFQTKNTFINFQKQWPGKRPYVLSQSGCCGIQKYAGLFFQKEVFTWQLLKKGLADVINLGLTGIPVTGIFTSGENSHKINVTFRKNKNRELFFRLLEISSLMPIFCISQNICNLFENFDEDSLAIVRKHIHRRYSLMPYIYSLLHESKESGAPLVRPLFFEFPDIFNTDTMHQFMIGPSLMAAPILEKGQREKNVYLPPGDWFEFETGKKYSGNANYSIPTKPGYYPLFIRGGSILPKCRVQNNLEKSMKGDLLLEIYPGLNLSGSLFLDDFKSKISGKNYFRQEYKGKRDRTGNLNISINTINKNYKPPQTEIDIRLPLNYKYIITDNVKKEGRRMNLILEDRIFDVYSFKIPLDDNELNCLFQPSWDLQ